MKYFEAFIDLSFPSVDPGQISGSGALGGAPLLCHWRWQVFFFLKGSFWKMVLGKLWWCGRILARNGVCTPTGETKHSGKKSKSKWDKFNKNQQRRDWPPDCLPSHEVILNCHLFFYKILLKKKKCQNHPNIYFDNIESWAMVIQIAMHQFNLNFTQLMITLRPLMSAFCDMFKR